METHLRESEEVLRRLNKLKKIKKLSASMDNFIDADFFMLFQHTADLKSAEKYVKIMLKSC